MSKHWRIRPFDAQSTANLAREAAVPSVVAQMLLARGIHQPQQAKEFLEAKLTHLRDPDQLPGVIEAAEHLNEAVKQGKKICIYGDYDVDGMTGTALLVQVLRLLGANVGSFVPSRLDDGYGLNHTALQQQASQGVKLVVTVDCGIGSISEAQTAADLGLELIITDHHAPGPTLPQAVAIVHPGLPDSPYPFRGLSGSGVAFKLAWALCQRASGAKKVAPAMKDFLLQAISLAALGTVADVVPLLDENRVLVRHGLLSLQDRPSLGLQHLMRVTNMDQKKVFESEDFAFSLAPRLNAAGRLGQANLGVELLTTDSESRAAELADYINQLNENRQTLERSIYLSASKQAQQRFNPVEDSALVLDSREWHVGVIGIVAGRLAEKFHRPVVLVSWDEMNNRPGTGSARSIPGFDLHSAFNACSHHLIKHGGHAAAAGMSIEEDKIDAFRAEFCEYAAANISHEELQAELFIDGEFPLSAFTTQVVDQLNQLAPFGAGNTRPIWCSSQVTLTDPPKAMGGGGRHLSMNVTHHNSRMRAVYFGGGDHAEALTAAISKPLDLAFKPVINDFRGRRNVELHLIDWRLSQPE